MTTKLEGGGRSTNLFCDFPNEKKQSWFINFFLNMYFLRRKKAFRIDHADLSRSSVYIMIEALIQIPVISSSVLDSESEPDPNEYQTRLRVNIKLTG